MFKNRSPSILILLLVIVVVGLVLRSWGIDRRLLWQDEAESAIYALQILDHGYPSSHYRGLPLYENASYLPSDDSKYELRSTNFVGSRFEKNKGWLPYYLMAGTFQLFGVGSWQARLPSVLVSGLTILLIVWFGSRHLGPGIGLLGAGLLAVNPVAVVMERQARYFSLTALLATWCFIFWWRTRHVDHAADRWLLVAGMLLLFYTHLPLFAMFAASLMWSPTQTPVYGRWRRWRVPLAVLAALTLPWFIAVQFWSSASAWSSAGAWATKGSAILVFGLVAGMLLLFQQLLRRIGLPSFFSLSHMGNVGPAVVWYLVYLTLGLMLLLPEEAFNARHFIALVPLLCLLTAGVLVGALHERSQPAHWMTLVLVASVWLVFSRGPLSGYGKAEWVRSALQYLDKQPPASGALLLTTYHHFPFWVHGGYPVELVWPIRREYLETYPGRLILFVPADQIWCESSYADWRRCRDPAGYNFSQRVRTCPRHQLSATLTVYDCPAPAVVPAV